MSDPQTTSRHAFPRVKRKRIRLPKILKRTRVAGIGNAFQKKGNNGPWSHPIEQKKTPNKRAWKQKCFLKARLENKRENSTKL